MPCSAAARLCIALACCALATAQGGFAQTPTPRSPSTVERPDGSRIGYYLNLPSRPGRRPLILMLQGSGCDSVALNARIPWMAARLAPNHVLLTIEKYGVTPGSTGAECTPDFWRRNTLQQRVSDALHVVAALRRQPWWNSEIVLFGGSEGGAIAAMLAPLVPETRSVIIWSSGIGQPVGEMILSALPPQIREEAGRVFAEARGNPTGERQWGGASYRWWSDAVDLVPARSLLQTPAPVLLIHGSRDQSAPVASAVAARTLVLAGGKRNFTYREYEGFDHFMVDAAGTDQREQVVSEAADWLRLALRR